jgi:hypothetical protein
MYSMFVYFKSLPGLDIKTSDENCQIIQIFLLEYCVQQCQV